MKNPVTYYANRFGKLFELSLIQKSQFVLASSSFVFSLLAISLFAIKYLPIFESSRIDFYIERQLFSLFFVHIAVSMYLYFIGEKIKKKGEEPSWYAYAAINIYLFITVMTSYYLGAYSIVIGVGISGGPIVGMILFPMRMIATTIVSGLILYLSLLFLSTFDYIPYAPVLKNSATAHLNLSWLVLASSLTGPHLLFVVGSAAFCIMRWKERERRVEYLSCTDPLTQINNRRNLMELLDYEIARSIRRNEPLSILIMDLDLFKSINDTHGHQAGDVVLQATASRLKNVIRKIDHIGRYGGEEFICILPNTSKEQAILSAERCRKAVESIQLDELKTSPTISLSISIGVETIPPYEIIAEDQLDIYKERLLNNADKALYEAKRHGRNQSQHFEDATLD